MGGMTVLTGLRRPVIAAPMAGGPSTPALVAAVGAAGGLGFLATGMITVDRLVADVARARARAGGSPFGVNVFAPGPAPPDPASIGAYAARLAADASRWRVTLGAPDGGDDGYPHKLAALLATPVPVVSFAFGLPDAAAVRALQSAGSEVWATVTNPRAVDEAAALGVDAIVVQGTEAGAHRGGADDADDYALLPLLRLAAARTRLPLIAAGGVTDGPALAAVLVAGAVAAQMGTAFLRATEAGTSPMHRSALAGPGDTRLTRAFTGRRARAIANDFLRRHDPAAPTGYPQVLNVTRPLLAAARRAGDATTANLWAGQAYALAREAPAAQIVEAVARDAAAALAAARSPWP